MKVRERPPTVIVRVISPAVAVAVAGHCAAPAVPVAPPSPPFVPPPAAPPTPVAPPLPPAPPVAPPAPGPPVLPATLPLPPAPLWPAAPDAVAPPLAVVPAAPTAPPVPAALPPAPGPPRPEEEPQVASANGSNAVAMNRIEALECPGVMVAYLRTYGWKCSPAAPSQSVRTGGFNGRFDLRTERRRIHALANRYAHSSDSFGNCFSE
jgi:hypothetical protein